MRKRKHSRYWYVKDPTGRYISSETENKDDAKALEDKYRQEAWSRKHFPDHWREVDAKPKKTLKEACVKWLNEHQHQSGVKANATFFRFWCEKYGDVLLNEITRERTHEIIKYRTTEQGSKKNSTANGYVAALHKVLTQAAKVWNQDEPWYTGQVPAFRYYQAPENRTRTLVATEWLALRPWLDTYGLRDVAEFSLQTLLREGNVLSLTVNHIRESCAYFRAGEMKNRIPHAIPLNQTAQEIIDRCSKGKIGQARIFTFRGKPIDHIRGAAHTAFREAVIRSGIEPCVFHDLRRTGASWLVRAGVPVEIVKRIGGWKPKGVAEQHYIHWDVESLRPWIAKIDEVLTNVVPLHKEA